MKWTQLRRMAISLPVAIFAACLMIGISEYGNKQTSQSLSNLAHAYDTRTALSTLTKEMLDAETGLRGYLLTSDENYLKPYNEAIQNISSTLQRIRQLIETTPQGMEFFVPMSHSISRKTAEMDLSLRLFREGNADALKFVMFTDMGNTDMSNIRELARKLDTLTAERSGRYQQDINSSLIMARIGVATVTLFGLFAFYLYLRQNNMVDRLHKREQALLSEERSRLENLVRERTATLTELANHLQQVREDERGHLARELHDELGALLTAAKLDVARLKSRIDMGNPEIADRIKHMTETLNSGIALKRRIVEDLRPSSLANLGLSTSLEILTSEFAQRSGIEVETIFEAVELPEATELTIYRMVQESLTNIGKYAKASHIQVTVHRYPTYVAVQIKDNGEGFDLASIRPNSHGLAGMRHRVEAAGGRLTINSALGAGTTVSAIIPTGATPAEAITAI
ncbi:CHASE3 domain-containing protein [Comamonas aquatica]|uniref:histidine kinase n=1 Tax=Comamonas aquatica TaxID=225991 RepID=A0AA43AWI8_9BURK|nr:CHASE3 domain-containing protein [Comamonas aquatica]MDH0201023.1 CHASE3 domain-containing protein [Comamonas aquatica]MDH1429603.1 CHASE3 domain-containing protein [Comamonas aquatica]MDH1445895.1 CHASE3 domain-containing protein [Comamonas aquatica]MDH1605489.1 CHASE3 domain-containing protein [Comamonas aquatica]MDH1617486.1 CHASE3 domain-containing protein [Comamonas aquatica]